MKRNDLRGRPAARMAMAVALCALAVPAGFALADAPEGRAANDALTLSVGDGRVINLPGPMSDVVVADPRIADVHVRSLRQLVVMGKAPGQTNIFVTTAGGKILYSNAIRVGNNLTSIDQMLALALPQSKVQVNTLNGMILLTGTVAAPEDAAEAERLVQAFSGASVTVVSRLRTATPLQVNLQVRIAEVNKNISKSIGFNLATADLTGGFKFGIGQGREVINQTWTIGGPLGTGLGVKPIADGTGKTIGTGATSNSTGTTLAADSKIFGLNFLAALDLAEDQGLATTLANPNLTALSGETASFLAGGEIPIPLSTGLGAVSVEYKQYGVSLAFTPTVLADGRISMRVRPEVSQLDNAASVKLDGYTIPGVSTRRAETTVELGSGQSFMIGGLLSNTSGNSINKAPFLGDLPILGNLFKSTKFNRSETELVIVVTPYLVHPVDAKDIVLPTDGYRTANDAQRILGGQLHDGKSGERAPAPRPGPARTVPSDQIPGFTQPPGDRPSASAKDKSRKMSARDAAPGFSF
jgi:pilus assembly protein CpaC